MDLLPRRKDFDLVKRPVPFWYLHSTTLAPLWCPKTPVLPGSQVTDSMCPEFRVLDAHKQLFLGVTKLNRDVYDSFLNIMVPHSKEGSSAGVRRPQRLAKNSANSFFLARTSGTAK